MARDGCIFTLHTYKSCAPLLWNFRGKAVKTILPTLSCCLVLLCCFVAVLLCCESLNSWVPWVSTENSTPEVLRRREEGCYHDGEIDAIATLQTGARFTTTTTTTTAAAETIARDFHHHHHRETYRLFAVSRSRQHTHTLSWGREVASHFSGVNCHNFSRNFEQAPVFSINPE